MVDRAALVQSVWRAALPAACIAASSYFGFHALVGPTGFFAWQDYKAERSELFQKAASVEQQKAALRRQVALLDPRRVDADLADELIRKNLNVLRDDEVMVALDPPK